VSRSRVLEIETISRQIETPKAYLTQQIDVPPPTTMAMMIISKQSQQRHTNRLHAVDPQGSWPRGLRSTLIYPTKEYSTIDILMDGLLLLQSWFFGVAFKKKTLKIIWSLTYPTIVFAGFWMKLTFVCVLRKRKNHLKDRFRFREKNVLFKGIFPNFLSSSREHFVYVYLFIRLLPK